MDFRLVPPEIISTLMNSGPGAGSWTAAAAAWSKLAGELSSAAAACEAAITDLTDREWRGPGSMATAATLYVQWLGETAARAEHTAGLVGAAAAAFQQAHATVVPPIGIALNRARLFALRQTNAMAVNAPAIAAAEAEYIEMWVQDVLAMHAYAARAAQATQFDAFSAFPATTGADAPPLPSGAGTTDPAPAGAVSEGVSVAQRYFGLLELLAVSRGQAGSIGTLSVPSSWIGPVEPRRTHPARGSDAGSGR